MHSEFARGRTPPRKKYREQTRHRLLQPLIQPVKAPPGHELVYSYMMKSLYDMNALRLSRVGGLLLFAYGIHRKEHEEYRPSQRRLVADA